MKLISDRLHEVVLFNVDKELTFTKDIIIEALRRDFIQESINRRTWSGELQQIGDTFSDPLIIDFRKRAFEIIEYYWIDNILYGMIKILDTPNGKILESCIDKVSFKIKGLYNASFSKLIISTFVAY